MCAMHLQTKNLTLVPQTLEDVRAMIAAMDPSTKAQLSADWLARLDAAGFAVRGCLDFPCSIATAVSL
jgi:hypothetical protein